MNNVVCKKCKEPCEVDGEYPKFSAWCLTCNKEPEGFDVLEYAAEWYAQLTDYTYDWMKDRE